MTKKQLIDLVILNLNGGIPVVESKAKYHPAEVEKYLEIVFDDFILKVCQAGMTNHDLSGLDSFTKPFEDVPVAYDINRDEYYCVLPIPTLQLPQFMAIRQVSPMKAPATNFRYTQYSSQAVLGNLDVGQIDTAIKYYVESSNDERNDKIRFWKGFNPDYTALLLRLVVPFASLNERTDIPIPANQALAMTAAVKEIMGQRTGTQPDLLNDNNPTN